ncbi:MAG: NADP-dependent phosphogluconate dehydrogenase [Chitinophagaceae bacterium]|nr:NADP-dependent phosphogluconate dehydrogenase [Chitinophagaceae bacterium]
MIGLGVMGCNLLLNMADHGFAVAGFDLDATKIAALENSATSGTSVKGFPTLDAMIASLALPRKLMMLVPAGKPVDDVLNNLLPLLQIGDVVIDGGNSHYTDTLRRVKFMQEKGIHFIGMGVSGGEQGARTGPSIMPGGDREAYAIVQPVLEAVAAKVNGNACVAYLGKDAAGHYVKMVHNGIEYAIMQLISETYWLLKHTMNYNNDQLHTVFKSWSEGPMQSFLLEITADIFLQPDDKSTNRLIDSILDKAGSKGTGKWTSQDAMDLPVPIPVIDMAVSMRELSSFKDERKQIAALYPTGKEMDLATINFVTQLHDALYFSTILCYVQGLAMLQSASSILKMDIPVDEVVRVWRGGCIIRSALLEVFWKVFQSNSQLTNLLMDENVATLLRPKEENLRAVIIAATQRGLPVAALMSALAYFDSYRSALLPTNLIQAQRDYFGAHTYQRTDNNGTFHTQWNSQV